MTHPSEHAWEQRELWSPPMPGDEGDEISDVIVYKFCNHCRMVLL